MRKNKQEKTKSKWETEQVTEEEALERPSTEKDMGEKGHEQKLENCKKEQARVRKN